MIFAEILAGGKGTRMNISDLPKQFLCISDKPIIIHTIEKFLLFNEIEKILVLIPENWINYTRDLIEKYLIDNKKIVLLTGGERRNETVMNGLNYILNNYNINDDDIVIIHDAVRPFVNYRIIKENIEYATKYGATDTAVNSVDTIVRSKNGKVINEIPYRGEMYQGQTPQSFKIKELIKAYEKLTEEQKILLTDTTKIMVLNNKDVFLVEGDYYNIKITTPYDLLLANAILQGLKIYDK